MMFLYRSRSLMLLTLALVLLAGAAVAQSVQGEPSDLEFNIDNITTGQPGTIDRLEIHYSTQRLNPVLDVRPEGSNFVVPAVPIKEIGRYVITAWKDDVPYFWSIRGNKILEGPLTLQVFDTIENLESVKISGLNLLLRKGESLVQLEYMLKVDNAARPQATVVGNPTIELSVPAGASGFDAYYTRGPEPTPVPVRSLGSGRVGLEAPLTTGQNQIRFVCTVPWMEGLQVPVGSSLDIEAWSLLATPENLDIRSFDLEQDRSQDLPDYLRFIGPTLEAGRDLDIRVNSRVPTAEAEEVFQTDVPGESAPAETEGDEENDGGGFPFVTTLPIFVVLIILIARRRRSKH